MLILGGILSLTGSIWLAIKNNNDTNSLRESTEKINFISSSISNKSDSIAEQTKILAEQLKDASNVIVNIHDAQKGIEKLNQELILYNTSLMQFSNEFQKKTMYEFYKTATTGTIDAFELNPSEYITIFQGGITLRNPIHYFSSTTKLFSDLPIEIKIIENKLKVSALIHDREGNVIIDIIENKWLSNKNSVLSKNYNKNGIEILDDKKRVIFNLRLTKNNELYINGIFFLKNRVAVIAGNVTEYIPYSDKEYQSKFEKRVSEIKQIFMHHGEGSHGVMVD